MTADALLIVAATTAVQLLLGYGFKVMVERKDSKIETLKNRVDELETQRIKTLEQTVADGSKEAAQRRRTIYERLEDHQRSMADLRARLDAVEAAIPQLPQIAREMSAAGSTLKTVTERIESITAQVITLVRDVARLEGVRKS